MSLFNPGCDFYDFEPKKPKGDVMTKEKWLEKFTKAYGKKARLLAVRLDGFTHKVFFDLGTKTSAVTRHEFSGCMPEGRWNKKAEELFKDVGHSSYQGNPEEIVFVMPEDR
jgi:hypothetical protein